MLPEITADQRQEMQRKAAEKREADQEFARLNLRNDFADANHWRRLASKYGLRLPSWYVRNTRSIRRALRLLGFDGSWVRDNTGAVSLKEWMELNWSWPSYAFIGLILESAHERDGQGELPELDDQDLIGTEDEDLLGFDADEDEEDDLI